VKIDLLAIYQKSLLGGLGGLLGWLLITVLVFLPSDTTFMLFARVLLTGCLIGVSLGAACGAWEGLFRDRSTRRLVRGAAIGSGIGLAGGAVGLVTGEIIFSLAGGGLFSRALGWGVFGGLVGTAEGIMNHMPQKARYGAFGGLLGGLIGGSTYEFLASALQALGLSRDVAIAGGGAIGLVLLGMFIGCLIGLVEDLLRAAWLQFTSGRFEGQTRTLDPSKPSTTIGRAELADICLLADPDVRSRHAVIESGAEGFSIVAVEGDVQVNQGRDWLPVTRHTLSSGELIQIGKSRARYHGADPA